MKSRKTYCRSLAIAILASLGASMLRSDAIVITRAMLATTISEIFVEQDSVVVELEIGVEDLQAFQNLLPDDLYERLGNTPEPWADRLYRFVTEDLTVREQHGRPIPGQLRAIEARTRVKRDEVTGEPLPLPPGEGQPVVFARLVYRTPGRPASLLIAPPRSESGTVTANIGFVTYHSGLHVNDFRYLGAEETLRLDWKDPWFSRFENRNLRRQFFAPISAFLYVEPYEVRKEIVLRPRDLEEWIDLGLEGKSVITIEEQEEIKRRVGEFLADRNPVTIDGQPVQGFLDRIHFIYRNLRTSGVVDPPRDLDNISATVGVIFVYPTNGLPEEVTMKWELFSDRIDMVPTSATDEAGSLPYNVSPDDDVLRWQNFLTNPTLPTLVEVTSPPRNRLWFALASLIGVFGLVLLGARHGKTVVRKQSPGKPVIASATGLALLVVVTLPRAVGTGVSDQQAETVVSSLLRNVYLAFDYREEERIYDTLERSAAGELLTDIYLETRRSLELENQGGARAKVKEVEIIEGEFTPLDGGRGFSSHLTWNVMGSVGHWGHIHQRTNQYEAQFTIRVVDGVWKITDLELLEEQRL